MPLLSNNVLCADPAGEHEFRNSIRRAWCMHYAVNDELVLRCRCLLHINCTTCRLHTTAYSHFIIVPLPSSNTSMINNLTESWRMSNKVSKLTGERKVRVRSDHNKKQCFVFRFIVTWGRYHIIEEKARGFVLLDRLFFGIKIRLSHSWHYCGNDTNIHR